MKWIVLFFFFGFQVVNAQNFTAMTYNIRLDTESDGENQWSLRKDFLCGQIEFYSPDVFGVQEALPSQMDYLKEQLLDYMVIGVGREDGKNKGEFSAIFYKKDVFELLESSTFWLSETPEKVSTGWDAALPRICTWVKLRVRGSDKEVLIMNTHFDHVGKLARKKSLELIQDKAKSINKANQPVIVMGDLNLEPETEEIKEFQTKMQDSRQVAGENAFGPEGTFSGWNVEKAVTRRIDYIFLSINDFELKKYAVLSDFVNQKYASDHLPVFVELTVK